MEDRFAPGNWRACVLGLGYVGLPFAVNAALRGVPTIGFDVDAHKVALLNAGESTVGDVSEVQLREALEAGLTFTSETAQIKGLDAYFLCVPSPLNTSREPDLSYIRAAVESVAEAIQPGALVSLESTTYPGTTEDIILGALEVAGFVLDRDVHVAYSPERVNPGGGIALSAIPKIVGGVSEESTAVASRVYRQLVDEIHEVTDAKVAEFAKLLENTYRAVNIALANEMAQLAHELGVSIWDTIDAAATKPFGFTPFYPGPGVGGHCIPLDPHYLAWKAKQAGVAIRFVDLAEQVNSKMPSYVVDRVSKMLNDVRKPISGSRILIVGLTYKANVGDDRESPSVEVARRLDGLGAHIEVIDPVLSPHAIQDQGFHVAAHPLPTGYDLAVVLTAHEDVDYQAVRSVAPMVFDTRGAYRARGLGDSGIVEI